MCETNNVVISKVLFFSIYKLLWPENNSRVFCLFVLFCFPKIIVLYIVENTFKYNNNNNNNYYYFYYI